MANDYGWEKPISKLSSHQLRNRLKVANSSLREHMVGEGKLFASIKKVLGRYAGMRRKDTPRALRPLWDAYMDAMGVL